MKPHEEEWKADGPRVRGPSTYDGRPVTLVNFCPSPDLVTDHDLARAKLAAQAPAMARLLLAMSERLWGQIYDAGPGSMSGEVSRVLRDAGVIP